MLSSLPLSLLALLSAYPALAIPPAPPTSLNDPFRSIALLVPKAPEQPICCLRPLPPLEPAQEDEDVLLSFEDWKAKRFAEQQARDRDSRDRDHHFGMNSAGQDGSADFGGADSGPGAQGSPIVPGSGGGSAGGSGGVGGDTNYIGEGGGGQGLDVDETEHGRNIAPHFRIPLTDRFNYASLDCSARVHTAHRSAQSPASVLSSKKDRYMLSPCAEPRQFIVVELCEDIKIDTVQLANYEFFSGVFKDFTVSVAKTYAPTDDGWIVAGTYRAQNMRGVQVSLFIV